jgi:hypothetical protein
MSHAGSSATATYGNRGTGGTWGGSASVREDVATVAAYQEYLKSTAGPQVSSWDDANAGSSGAAAGRVKSAAQSPPITVLELWEGTVTQIDGDFFEATLLSSGNDPLRLDAEFDVDDLSRDDKELLAPGASFYLTISRVRSRDGRVGRRADIRFRRLPKWRDVEIDAVWERARERRRALGLEEA